MRSTALMVGVSAAVLFALLQPTLARTLGLPRVVSGLVVGGFLLVVAAAAGAHAWRGFDSGLYQTFNALENVWCGVGSLVLVYAARVHGYFFWTIYVVLCVHTGSIGHLPRFNGALYVLAPLTLATAFVVFRNDWTGAQITVLMGLVAFVAWATTLRSTRYVSERLAATRLLEVRERDVALLRDRERIARDLHDGLGAVLTGLLYRVQASEHDSELDSEDIEERLRECIEELRSAVWVLRDDSRTFEALMAWLRARCSDLCANDVELTFEVTQGVPALDGSLQLHLVRMVLEAVRNAVRHGRARHVQVSIQVLEEVLVLVRDDGVGFDDDKLEQRAGGLANLQNRSSALGGHLTIATSALGTELRFQCRTICTRT
jgi:signal transduction histidine kinase